MIRGSLACIPGNATEIYILFARTLQFLVMLHLKQTTQLFAPSGP